MSNDQETRAIQESLLELMKIFDGLCKAHGIKYTLHGGSLLGAVREKGFIPWDDDIDIGMTRAQYRKLKKLLPTDKTREIYLDYKRDKVQKIWRNEPGKDSVWLDIFVYDYISEKPLSRKLKILCIKLLTPFAKSETTIETFRFNNRAKGLSKIIYELIYNMGRPFPLEKRIRFFDRFCERAFTGGKRFVHRANDQLWAMVMILPVSSLRRFKRVPFEDTTFMISKDYDKILTQLYGEDYMTPRKTIDESNTVHSIYRDNA